jgi:hypothetical protein
MAEGVDDFTTIHERRAPSKRVRIRYRVHGVWFDSPSEAVRHYNRTEAGRGRRGPGSPGSDESTGRRKGVVPRR